MSVSSAFCKFTSDSSPSPPSGIYWAFCVCMCVYHHAVYREFMTGRWQACPPPSPSQIYAQDAVFVPVCLTIFCRSISRPFGVTPNGDVRPRLFRRLSSRLHAVQIYFSSFVHSIGIIPSVFYYGRKKKINHPGPSWRETKEMKYKSNYDIAQLRTLRKTLSSVSFPL